MGIKEYIGSKLSGDENYIQHYGVGKLDGAPGRGSGRYPLGSGDNPNQHGSGDLLNRIKELEEIGATYVDPNTGEEYKGEQAIAKIILGPRGTTTQLRIEKSIASNEERAKKVAAARALRDQGLSLNQIAEKMGFANDSSVRSLLNENSEARMLKSQVTAKYLKEVIAELGIVDVGKGAENQLGISREKLEQALYLLQREGYPVYGAGIPQVTNKGQQTNMKVICPIGTPHKDIYNFENVHSIDEFRKVLGEEIHSVDESEKRLAEDGEVIRDRFYYPASLDSKRLQIVYAEDGGTKKDGVIELRRGVEDISLGDSHYAQVRIMVDGTHYLKGMALYSDDLPEGVDVRFNTNKSNKLPLTDVLKPIKKDPDNPFGSLIKETGGQSFYDDPNGNYINPEDGRRQSLRLINKRSDEGDWNDWSDKLPSQFLSKQPMPLIKRQLYLAEADKQREFEEICSLTNPTVKKRLLESFADDCDAAAVHLKAAALPRQKYKVILPVDSLKDTEVYAPGYENGEKVALVRFPHEGTYQIPILTVNNKHPEGRIILGNTPKDAIGINSTVANQLSGADFDGDTVMVIPTGKNGVNISAKHPLKQLENFDAKMEYGYDEKRVDENGQVHYIRNGKEYKLMKNTQNEMGKISNLITDMTLKGANDEELARATKHSQCVIDAEKHHLDYKQSELDNRIMELKKRYQAHTDEDGVERYGAGTLISRSKGQVSVTKRKGSPKINQPGKDWYDPTRPEGALIYKTVDEKDRYYVDKNGKRTERTQKSTQMAETDDAFTLSSGHPTEEAYAKYANHMKSLANKARMEMVNTPGLKYSPSAKIVYKNEVVSLNDKLNTAIANAPKERQALRIANTVINAKKKAMEDEGMTHKEIESDLKKIRQKEITKARIQVGASGKDSRIEITDKEWEAIQAGAISDNKLSQILNHTDVEKIKERATPRSNKKALSTAKINKIAQMQANGYTIDEIAKAIGVSTSTVNNYL